MVTVIWSSFIFVPHLSFNDKIPETAMGTKINAQGGSHSEYVDAIYE